MIPCPHCSAQVPSNFRFCGACGGAIAAAAPKVEAPVAQPAPVTQPTQPTPEPQRVVAPAAKTVVAHLVVIKPDGNEGARIALSEGETILGRSSSAEVLATDPFLSPEHASVGYSAGRFVVKDLGSLNGVFVRIRQERELQDGDFIRVGQELLHFQLMGNVAPIVAKTAETLTNGSPDVGYWGRLALVGGPDLESRAFLLGSDEVTIGREVGDILFRDDGFVSGRHARIAKAENRVSLKDLGSSNGTYVRIRGSHDLAPDDLILMGQQLFKLVPA